MSWAVSRAKLWVAAVPPQPNPGFCTINASGTYLKLLLCSLAGCGTFPEMAEITSWETSTKKPWFGNSHHRMCVPGTTNNHRHLSNSYRSNGDAFLQERLCQTTPGFLPRLQTSSSEQSGNKRRQFLNFGWLGRKPLGEVRNLIPA